MEYDLATSDGLKGAVRVMLGWRRHLMSGKATVEPVQQSYDAARDEHIRRRAERKAEQEEKKRLEHEKKLQY